MFNASLYQGMMGTHDVETYNFFKGHPGLEGCMYV
jgi:hypothetical protein